MNCTELDYYEVLNVPRNASKEDILLAYRKLANHLVPNRDVKYEKDFAPDTDTHLFPMAKNRQWDYINMAYDVLGNDLHRAIYDRYGEAGLFEGILLPNGYFPPYMYHGDNMKVYHSVFSTFSPYASVIDAVTNPPALYSTPEHGVGVRTRDPPVEKIVCLSLEEVRFGCTKLMHVWRQDYVDEKEITTEKKRKTLKLMISPGVTPGTRYCFREQGDRNPTRIPADIVFIIDDKPHPTFKRQNNHDLVYVHRIDLCQALVGFWLNIETLDKRNLRVQIYDVVYPGYTKIIPSEGLPKCNYSDSVAVSLEKEKPKEFGDLIITFEIEFPKVMDEKMRAMARKFFKELKNMEKDALNAPNPFKAFLKKTRKHVSHNECN